MPPPKESSRIASEERCLRSVPEGMADMSWALRVLSWILNRTLDLVLALPFRDLSSGFRLYKRDMLLALRPAPAISTSWKNS